MTTAEYITREYLSGIKNDYRRNGNNTDWHFQRVMQIPLQGISFEIPLFVLQDEGSFRTNKYSKIAFFTGPSDVANAYTTIEAQFKFCLGVPKQYGMVKFHVPNSDTFYYCTAGAIFKSDWTPVCMGTWTAQYNEKGDIEYLTPLFRIAPSVMLEKEDAVQRFIVGKYMRVLLENSVYSPDSHNRKNVSVIIESIPFHMIQPRQPDIHTTNEKLIDIIKANKKELCI